MLTKIDGVTFRRLGQEGKTLAKIKRDALAGK